MTSHWSTSFLFALTSQIFYDLTSKTRIVSEQEILFYSPFNFYYWKNHNNRIFFRHALFFLQLININHQLPTNRAKLIVIRWATTTYRYEHARHIYIVVLCRMAFDNSLQLRWYPRLHLILLLNVHWPLCLLFTPSGLVNEVVLDMIWVKHREYKSWITLMSLSLEMWKLYE
jgi:hypothetical protein